MRPRTFHMLRHTVVVPLVRNDGAPSGYREAFRSALLDAGITGWTEHETVGAWRGKLEPGVTFEILSTSNDCHKQLAAIARATMPDQEAIQVTYDPEWTRVLEA